MKWLVCGGREFGREFDRKGSYRPTWEDEYEFVFRTLDKLSVERSSFCNHSGNWLPIDIEIINGGSTGADRASSDWAVSNWCVFREHLADWDRFKKQAGILRNISMLEDEKPDLVIAFPGGRGTAHMVSIAKKADIEVIEVEYDGRS